MQISKKALLVLSVIGCSLAISAQSNRIRFDIEKGSANDGEVTLTGGKLRATGGAYLMNILNGYYDFKTGEFYFGGYVKNTNTKALPNLALREINFDGLSSDASSDPRQRLTKFAVQRFSGYTLISIKDLACHEQFNTYFDRGWRGLADVELKINTNRTGSFKVTVTKITSAFEGPITLTKLPKDFPTQVEGLIAQGETKSGTLMSVTFPPPEEFAIRFSAFIPGDRIIGPPQSVCLPAQGVLPRQLYYNGNNRSFSASSPSVTGFKIEQTVTIITEIIGKPGSTGIKEGTNPQSRVGLTKEYASDALADGKIDSRDDDARLYDCSRLHNVATTSDDNLNISVRPLTTEKISVRFHGYAKNPLVPLAPAIDWDVTLTIDNSGNQGSYLLVANHDGFPAYEVYVDKQRVHDHWPGNPPYDSWFGVQRALIGDKEDVRVRKTGFLK